MRNGLYILMGLILLTPLAGCKHENDGMSEQQQEKANRLDTIVKTSGGDWEKVSAADREYLVKELASGSESSAKMLLLAKAGKIKGTPGGGPNSAPPGR